MEVSAELALLARVRARSRVCVVLVHINVSRWYELCVGVRPYAKLLANVAAMASCLCVGNVQFASVCDVLLSFSQRTGAIISDWMN